MRMVGILVAGLLTIGSGSLLVSDGSAIQYFSTRVGEQLPLQMPDESVITLNTNSRIKTQSDGEMLRVGVMTGEVLFDNHPDVKRQLIVSVGDLQIVDTTAIFAVELLDDEGVQQVGAQWEPSNHGRRWTVCLTPIQPGKPMDPGSGGGWKATTCWPAILATFC